MEVSSQFHTPDKPPSRQKIANDILYIGVWVDTRAVLGCCSIMTFLTEYM